MKKKKIIIPLALFLCLFSAHYGQKAHKKRTDGFSPSRLSAALHFNKEYEGQPLSLQENRELALALSQPYHYLGFGGQCYAFVSKDDQYVIKFFKDHGDTAKALLKLPLPSFISKKLYDKLSAITYKRQKEFSSYIIAEKFLKKESGLIFTHLNPSKHLLTTLSIKDKAGRNFQLSLDDHAFLVQRKARLITPTLDAFMKEKREDRARNLIKNLVHFFVERAEKGIYDDDARIHRNFGCDDELPILIDIGRLRHDKEHCDKKMIASDVIKVNHHFIDYLGEHYPKLKDIFYEELQALSEEDSPCQG